MPDSKKPKSNDDDHLVVHPDSRLSVISSSDQPALSEIIDRSLAHIESTKTPLVREGFTVKEQEFEIAPGIWIVMCWIPPGDFLMGSPEDEEGRDDDETQHLVTLTKGYWLAKTQTTQSQWEAVMGDNPSYFKGETRPVEAVDWDDITGSGGFMAKINRFAATGEIFFLPSEAQWEYACRAGHASALNNGKNLSSEIGHDPNLDEVGWHSENSEGETHAVGQKKANAWGLQDMHGNVSEWCDDWFTPYSAGSLVDPRGLDSAGIRVVRGGNWNSYPEDCRAASRAIPIFGGDIYIGFRIARISDAK